MSETAEMVDNQQDWEVLVHGQTLDELPTDLYIPPDALKVFLEAFQGPLDLLLYLIKKQNIDILDIPIVDITRQYVDYIDLMQDLKLELAAEYLVMAAMLAEIKSRMLLPRPVSEEEEGGDPRAELIARLREYERFKQAAESIAEMPRVERDIFVAEALAPEVDTIEKPDVLVAFPDVLDALKAVMARAKLYTHHQIAREALSIRERMTIVLSSVKADNFTRFEHLFTAEEGRMGVVVTFIAILELVRNGLLELTQEKAYAAIYVKAKGEENHE